MKTFALTTDSAQSKLLSKAAKNPYAQYSSSCTRCKVKVSQGHTYCNQCAYRADGMFSWRFHCPKFRRLTLSSMRHMRKAKQGKIRRAYC
jgi:hypothetical protein